jgi:hypothetical protein
VSTIKGFRTWCERGQALAEYMPTMAGAMAISILLWMSLAGGVKNAYCDAIDALTDRPDICIDDSGGGGTTDEGEPEVPPPPPDPTCIVTLSGAGSNPADWSREWDGNDETLTINVADLGKEDSIPWDVSLAVPASGAASEVGSGTISADGSYPVTIHYPADGDWGAVGADGKFRSHATLSVAGGICAGASWERWYTPLYTADLAVTAFTHAPEPICACDKYTIYATVKNLGPNPSQIYEGQGAILTVSTPACVDVQKVTTPKGTCSYTKNQAVCDLGALNVNESVKVTVNVINTVECGDMVSTASVYAPKPPDPDLSNNTATDVAHTKK